MVAYKCIFLDWFYTLSNRQFGIDYQHIEPGVRLVPELQMLVRSLL